MTERHPVCAPFWSFDLAFAAMPFALVVPIVARRIAGKPLPPLAEAGFWAFALLFFALLLRAHLRPRYALVLDGEGVALTIPGSLLAPRPWRLAWSEIRRAILLKNPDARILVFETVRPTFEWGSHSVVLSGHGLRAADEPALLAALARRGVPSAETPPPFAVTPEREFGIRRDRTASTRAFLAISVVAFLVPLLRGLHDSLSGRSVTLADLVLILLSLVSGLFALVSLRGQRSLLVADPEGLAFVTRTPRFLWRPPTERADWSLAWPDLLRAEAKDGRLVFETPTVPRSVAFAAPPKAGIEDPDALLALLRGRGIEVAAP